MRKTKLLPYTGTEGHDCVSYYQKDGIELWSTLALRSHANKLILSLQRIVDNQEEQIELLKKSNDFYKDNDNWEIPDIDSRGFDGMSAKSVIELEDYCTEDFVSGKLARQIQKELLPLEEELKGLKGE